MIQIFRLLCLCFWMLLLPTGLLCAEGGDDVLARMIHLSKEKNTVYRLLDKVSEQTGFLFIYDSKLIGTHPERRLHHPAGNLPDHRKQRTELACDRRSHPDLRAATCQANSHSRDHSSKRGRQPFYCQRNPTRPTDE